VYRMVTESWAEDADQRFVKATVAVSPCLTAAVAELMVRVCANGTPACEGPELNKPTPNAATTASEIRLKIVFLFIDFLSKVIRKTFLRTAGKKFLPAL